MRLLRRSRKPSDSEPLDDQARSSLRDFVYLNIDKVRSLVAQLQHGAPETVQRTDVGQAELGLRSVLAAKYAFETSSTETRSIHHRLYDILEDHLKEEPKLLSVGPDLDHTQWQPDLFRDGTFVLIHGYVRILDFDRLVASLRISTRVASLTTRLSKQPNPLKGQEDTIKSVTKVVEDVYADALRVKVWPYESMQTHYFVGNLDPDYLQQKRANLLGGGLLDSGSRWWTMGIVNAAPTATGLQPNPDSASTNIEQGMENIMLALNEIASLAAPEAFPAVGFTPLAIYRRL